MRKRRRRRYLDNLGVFLRVGEGESRTPRPSKDDPTIDPEMLTQFLDILWDREEEEEEVVIC